MNFQLGIISLVVAIHPLLLLDKIGFNSDLTVLISPLVWFVTYKILNLLLHEHVGKLYVAAVSYYCWIFHCILNIQLMFMFTNIPPDYMILYFWNIPTLTILVPLFLYGYKLTAEDLADAIMNTVFCVLLITMMCVFLFILNDHRKYVQNLPVMKFTYHYPQTKQDDETCIYNNNKYII